MNPLGKLSVYLSANPIWKRFLSASVWTAVGSVAMRGFGLVSTTVSARLLGVEDYGRLGMVLNTIGTFAFFAWVTMSVTATKYVAEMCDLNPARTGRIIGICNAISMAFGCLSMVVLFAFAPWLSDSMLADSGLSLLLRISAVSVLLNAINGTQTGILYGLECFRTTAVLNFTCGLMNLIVTIALTYLWGLEGAAVAIGISALLQCMITSLSLRREYARRSIKPTLKGSREELPVLVNFSVPHLLSASLSMPVLWVCNAMLVRTPGGYVEMGLFSAASRWREALMFVPQIMSKVGSVMHAERLGKMDYKGVRKILMASLLINFVVAGGVALVLALGRHYVMASFGEGFTGKGELVLVIALACGLVQAMTIPFNNITTSAGKMWLNFLISLSYSAVLLVSCWYGIQHGSVGFACAWTLASIVQFAGLFYVALKIVKRQTV